MKININAFLKTLPIMGKGMLGIFVVTAIIIVFMILLNLFTKEKKQ